MQGFCAYSGRLNLPHGFWSNDSRGVAPGAIRLEVWEAFPVHDGFGDD
jgi:hypothetical protein